MNKIFTVVMIWSLFMLTGCGHSRTDSQGAILLHEEQLELVQQAIEAFQKDSNGLLPIKTKNADTPLYEKYLVDFTKLIPGYLAEAPANAYESGGIYQYIIVEAEAAPQIKVIDLRMAESVSELQICLQTYKETHIYPPYSKIVADGVFTLDYEKLGYQGPLYVESPYTGNHLPFIINAEGKVFIDYQEDLKELLQDKSMNVKEGEDIRYILLESSNMAPAFSLPYEIKNGEVIFSPQS